MQKKLVVVLAVLVLVVFSASTVFAADASMNKGKTEAFFNSCCLGPRIGIEMNDGKSVSTMEYLLYLGYVPYIGIVGMVPRIVLAADAGQKNGVGGFLAGCCIGPRVGMELNERNIRITEWIRLIPVVGIVPSVIHGVEAYNGKTMQEIEKNENLRKMK